MKSAAGVQMAIEQAVETIQNAIYCKCTAGPFVDREAWVVHVREGIPTITRRKRPDFRKQDEERQATMNYIAAHGILSSGILPEESENQSSGKGDNHGDR